MTTVSEVQYRDGFQGKRIYFSPEDDRGATYDGIVVPVKWFGVDKAAQIVFGNGLKNTFTRFAVDGYLRLSDYVPALKTRADKYKKGMKIVSGVCDTSKFFISLAKLCKTFQSYRNEKVSASALFDKSLAALNYGLKFLKFDRTLNGRKKPAGYDWLNLAINVTDLISALRALRATLPKVVKIADHYKAFEEAVETRVTPSSSPPTVVDSAHSLGSLASPMAARAGDGDLFSLAQSGVTPRPTVQISPRDKRKMDGAARAQKDRLDPAVRSLVGAQWIDCALSIALMVPYVVLPAIGVADDLKLTQNRIYRFFDQYVRTPPYMMLYLIGLVQPLVKQRMADIEKAVMGAGYTYKKPRAGDVLSPTGSSPDRTSALRSVVSPAANGRGSVA